MHDRHDTHDTIDTADGPMRLFTATPEGAPRGAVVAGQRPSCY
jgi:hypothetical protein